MISWYREGEASVLHAIRFRITWRDIIITISKIEMGPMVAYRRHIRLRWYIKGYGFKWLCTNEAGYYDAITSYLFDRDMVAVPRNTRLNKREHSDV